MQNLNVIHNAPTIIAPKKFAKVIITKNLDSEFDYIIGDGDEFCVGEIVLASFRNKPEFGMVVGVSDTSEVPEKKLKKIEKYADGKFALSENMLKYVFWLAEYYSESKGNALGLTINNKILKDIKNYKTKAAEAKTTTQREYTDEQKLAVESLKSGIGKFGVTLLHGVTGSGKTEVYFEAIKEILQNKDDKNGGSQVLIILPEILLTTQILKRFKDFFGFEPTVWHSAMTPAKRRNAFFDIAGGVAKVVIGARSSVNLPFANLKMIVVDEEHDGSLKQEEQVIYNARDAAVMRGKIEDVPVVLVSATPSAETYYNAKNGRYNYVRLENRFFTEDLPEICVIDMRAEKIPASQFISKKLEDEIRKNIEKQKQSLLFLNRKGYAPLTLCGKCGYKFKSPDTSSWMVMYKGKNGKEFLKCHHSGYVMDLPEKCPDCENEGTFRTCGPGVQRIADEVRTKFPEARVLEMTRDSFDNANQAEEIIRQIEQNEVDIIIGTQIVAKGYNFPALRMVGVIDGDFGLDFTDMRAGERSFQLLQQVSGRAGRTEKGYVFIQSYSPENNVIEALKKYDNEGFLKVEIENRQKGDLPPFSRLVGVIVSGENEADSKQAAKDVMSAMMHKQIEVYGPSPAVFYELRGKFRNRILLKAERNFNIQKFIKDRLSGLKIKNGVSVKIDIDPYSFS